MRFGNHEKFIIFRIPFMTWQLLKNIYCSITILNMQTNAELEVPNLINRVEVRGKFP